MVRGNLPFKESTARKFMKISAYALTKSFTCERFIPLWGTLYKLTKLDDGIIHSDMQRGRRSTGSTMRVKAAYSEYKAANQAQVAGVLLRGSDCGSLQPANRKVF
jgi:hypothetical protein